MAVSDQIGRIGLCGCLLGAMALAGCGGGSSSDSAPSGSADAGDSGGDPGTTDAGGSGDQGGDGGAGAVPFDGDWISACRADGDGGFERERLSIDGALALVRSSVYLDADCQSADPDDAVLSSRVRMTYPGGTTATSLGAAVSIDAQVEWFEIDGERYTPDELNALFGAGIAAGLVDGLGGPAHDIGLRVGDRLYFGDLDADPARDGSSAAARPQVLDLDDPFAAVR